MTLLSNNTGVPKEQLSAYQRWEMASFGDERPSVVAARPKPEPTVPLPTRESVARIREDARLEGQAAGRISGYAEGQALGLAQGLAEGRAEAAREIARLRQVADSFGAAVMDADELIAHEMLDLALDVAKAMLKFSLAVRPELVLPIVKEAIHYLPSLQQPALLFLNPDDALVVGDQIGDDLIKSGWRIIEDNQMARGGCRIDTASNQIDASMPIRWQRLTAAFGKDGDWLLP